MTQTQIKPREHSHSEPILCYYQNSASYIQILRRMSHQNLPPFERVVFPHQRLLFEASPDAILEVHSQDGKQEILCSSLCVLESILNVQPLNDG